MTADERTAHAIVAHLCDHGDTGKHDEICVAISAALRAARAQGIEEAAGVAETTSLPSDCLWAMNHSCCASGHRRTIAAAIRALPAARTEIRPEVLAFAQAMESALRRHDAERGDSWKTCDMDWLFGRLQNESNELRHEVVCCAVHTVKPYDSVQREAADVANFAMMIWNVAAVAAARRGQ